ncbi:MULTISPECIES: hypothetical protein [unclassified Streptomyces]|uniref:hypothetical protein n=1 Tax=unclassified Streptomyces TaxID=2593676 RepID=UPI003400C837
MPTALRAALACVLTVGALTACSAEEDAVELKYVQDYSGHPPLAVVGFPSTGSLGITQEVVWRIADGDAGGLASLVRDGQDNGVARRTAENWIAAFRKGAGGKVTAEFYDDGSYRQTVVLYLHDTDQIKQLHVLPAWAEGKDVWRVSMGEPDPAEATAVSSWIPKTPGALGSKSLP